MEMLLLTSFMLLSISFRGRVNGLNTSEKHFQWIKHAVEFIRTNEEGSLDIVLHDDLSIDDGIGEILEILRRFMSSEAVVKLESLSLKTPTRTKILFVLDGSNLDTLQKSLLQIRQRHRTLSDSIHEYYFILSNTDLTYQHSSLFRTPVSCHMLFIHITDSDLTIHRISAANVAHVKSFNSKASFQRIFDDRPDWHGYKVNIYTSDRRLPFSGMVAGNLLGVEIEACKAILDRANMSHQYLIIPPELNFFKYRRSLERLLKNNSIQLVISRMGVTNPYGEHLVTPDTDGVCLLTPRSSQRNFIYHLVHPFETDTWMIVALVVLLDVIIGLFFPIAFPHNLIMILLFGDSLAGHAQTRWTRFYCFACTIFLFLLSEAYLAKAIIYMTLTRYTPAMKTLAEFVASDVPILIGAGIVSHLNHSDLLSQLLSKTVEDPNFYFHLDSDRYAYIVRCSFGQQLMERQVMEDYHKFGYEGKRRFYLVEERIQWDLTMLMVQYRFMYYARFQRALSWLHEAGLWDKWINDIQKKREQMTRYDLRDEGDILYLGDLVAIWYVVVVGLVVSVATFLVELVWYNAKTLSGQLIQSQVTMIAQ